MTDLKSRIRDVQVKAVIAQYNPNSKQRAIFAKEAEEGGAAHAASDMSAMKSMAEPGAFGIHGLPKEVEHGNSSYLFPQIAKGNFETRVEHQPGDWHHEHSYTVRLEPRTGDHIKPVPPSKFDLAEGRGSGKWYDDRLAKPELVDPKFPDIGYTAKPLPGTGWGTENVKTEPGKLYRGMSFGEMESIKRNGYIKSNGSYNLGDEQEGLTYFGDRSDQAFTYANSFQPAPYVATFDRPAYVVAIKDAPESILNRDAAPQGEIGVKGQIPTSMVSDVWEVRPYMVKGGMMETVEQYNSRLGGLGWTEGSRKNPSASAVYKRIDPPWATVVGQYNPSSKDRAIFAKEAEGGEAAGASHVSRTMEVMKPMKQGSLFPSAHNGAKSGGLDVHVSDGHSAMPPVQKSLHEQLFHSSDTSPKEMELRQETWNHPEWQGHLAGKMPLSPEGKKIQKPFMTTGYARGYEGMAKETKKARAKLGGPGTGDWTPDELAKEPSDKLYSSWLTARAVIADQKTQSVIDEVSKHGLAPDDPRILAGEKRVIPAAEMYQHLNSADRAYVDQKAAGIGVTLESMKSNLEEIRLKGNSPMSAEAPHWYEAEFAQTSELAKQFDQPHYIVAGVAAAHSPLTSWDKNRRMTAMTLSAWQENPKVHLSAGEIESYQKEYAAKEADWATQQARFAKSGTETKVYLEAKDARLHPLEVDGEGDYHIQDLPPEIVAEKVHLPTLTDNSERAFSILHDNSVNVMIGRPKIASFYNNIIAPHNQEYSTVDSWMVRAAMGDQTYHWRNGDHPMEWRAKGSMNEQEVLDGAMPTNGTVATGLMPLIRQAMHDNAQKQGLSDPAYQALTWFNIRSYYEGAGAGSVGTSATKVKASSGDRQKLESKFAASRTRNRAKRSSRQPTLLPVAPQPTG